MRDRRVQYTRFHAPVMITVAMLMFVSAAEVKAFQTTVRPVVIPQPPLKVTAPRPAAPRVGSGTPGRGATPGATRDTFKRALTASRPSMSGVGRSAFARPGYRVVRTKGGGEIHRGLDGKIREVHARGMEIYHGPGGSKTVTAERPLGVVVVGNQYGHGYVQQPFSYIGAEFVQRTYSGNKVADARIYQRYAYYDKFYLDVYAPRAFYGPSFYEWAYNAWSSPAGYSWGGDSDPWYSYFALYFAPYPVYAGPSHWLTDYVLTQTLRNAYQERSPEPADGQAAASSTQLAPEAVQPIAGETARTLSAPAPAPLTAEVKQDITEEVRRQIALENSEASAGINHSPDPDSSGIARMLADDTPHVFVVSAALDLASTAGECAVTEGDVLQLKPGTPPAAAAANLIVLASKGADCVRGAMVTVGVADLQDMQNRMRETIDQGLGYLQENQGRNGIPAAPVSAAQPPSQSGWGAIAPPPALDVTAELSQLAKEADLAEREVLKSEPAPKPAHASAPVPSASLMGKSPDQVKAMLGKPNSVVDLGAKKIYVFDDRRVTFTHGKATDIQ